MSFFPRNWDVSDFHRRLNFAIAVDVSTHCDNRTNGLSIVLNPTRISNILYLVQELAFFEYETEIKEDNSFKLHFKVGKGLKIFQPSQYIFGDALLSIRAPMNRI